MKSSDTAFPIEDFSLQVLHETEHWIAINKPSGIMVHRTGITEDKHFLLGMVRDMINQWVYPIHRLDRGTSGVLLFAKSPESASVLGIALATREVHKTYIAALRGWIPEEGTINYSLQKEEKEEKQAAITDFKRLAVSELTIGIGRYPTSRFSLAEIYPQTGRFHQIRRHFSHLRHPVLNDKRHGDVKHNAWLRNEHHLRRMLLHARVLTFKDPFSDVQHHVEAPIGPHLAKALSLSGLPCPFQVDVKLQDWVDITQLPPKTSHQTE